MPLITCIDCKKSISDRIENCPHCGCPVSLSKESAEAAILKEKEEIAEDIKKEAVKIDVDIDAELDVLYEMFAPAVLNEREIKKVGREVVKYFDKYKDICDGVLYITLQDLERAIAKREEAIKYVDEMKEKQLGAALDQYNRDINKPINGLGFGIISTSAADTMLYGAMSAHNAAKQYMKNTKTANENLHKNLLALGANGDDLMRESDVIDFKYKIRKVLEDIKNFAEIKYFLDSHKEFKYFPQQYDNGKEIDGVTIYSILYPNTGAKVLYSGIPKDSGITREILEKAEKAGYITRYHGGYYGTTLKYEKEFLEEKFKKENPEEYANLQAQKQNQAEVVYNKAMEDLEKGLYYEAATALGSIAEYKDAIEISVKLWHEHILRQDRIVTCFWDIYMLKDNGTVVAGGGANSETRAIVADWHGVDSICSMHRLSALTFDGQIVSLHKILFDDYSTDEYKTIPTAQLNNIKSINGRYTWSAITQDDSLIVLGKNEAGLCDKATGLKNVKKVSAQTTENIAILGKNGKVTSIGGDYSGYESWENIVDIVSDYSGLYGFKQDGTVYFSEWKDNSPRAKYKVYKGTHPSEWKDVYKYFGDCCAIDKYGRVYAYGTNKLADQLDGLEGIVHIEHDTSFTVCIRADGTLLVIESKLDISKWEDIISIWGSYNYVLGLKKDGSFVCDGDVKNPEEIASLRMFDNVNVNMLEIAKEKFLEQKRAKQQAEKEQAILNAKRELEDCKNALKNLKGIFTGSKRKQLESKIAELEQVIHNG